MGQPIAAFERVATEAPRTAFDSFQEDALNNPVAVEFDPFQSGSFDGTPKPIEGINLDFSATSRLRDEAVFKQQVWTIKLGGSFTRYSELCEYVAGLDEEARAPTNVRSPDGTGTLYSLLKTVCGVYNFHSIGDSSLGGNEAINPMWSFNRDDDIVHPIGANDTRGESEVGMGRCYAKMYDRNQHMLHLIFGNAYYQGLNSYISGGSSTGPFTKLFNTEDGEDLRSTLTKMADKTLNILIALPFKPLTMFMSATQLGDKYKVSKFATFRPNMVLYYRMVNSMLITIGLGMGLGMEEMSGGINESGLNDLFKVIGRPEILRDGFDIFKTLSKRYVRMNRSSGVYGSQPTPKLDDVMNDETGGIGATLKRIIQAGEAIGEDIADQAWISAMGGLHYVSFRIERTDNASESISNSTGTSNIADKMNAKSQEAMEKRFQFGMNTGLAPLDAFGNWAWNVIKSSIDTVTGGRSSGYFEQIMGAGFYEFPEVWKGSSFSKSYSFNLHLAARYGDPISIFQSIYVPLIMLIAGGCPRGVGSSMYASPFVVRAYCKGQFAVPLGIIDNISINRGTGEFGWTQENLPTAVDVSFSIKDLSPVMFLGIASGGVSFIEAFKQNIGMVEYLTTLSGVGLRERLYRLPAIRRRIHETISKLRYTTFNPNYWGTWLGHRAIVQTVSGFRPWDWKTTNR